MKRKDDLKITEEGNSIHIVNKIKLPTFTLLALPMLVLIGTIIAAISSFSDPDLSTETALQITSITTVLIAIGAFGGIWWGHKTFNKSLEIVLDKGNKLVNLPKENLSFQFSDIKVVKAVPKQSPQQVVGFAGSGVGVGTMLPTESISTIKFDLSTGEAVSNATIISFSTASKVVETINKTLGLS